MAAQASAHIASGEPGSAQQYAPVKGFHINSPLVESRPLGLLLSAIQKQNPQNLSKSAGGASPEFKEHLDDAAQPSCEVWLKFDALQPSGSYKIRGIGQMCERAARRGVKHFVASSGGNAGLAAAYSGRMLGVRTTIFLPVTTASFMVDRLRAEGAQVHVAGADWSAADAKARQLIADSPNPEEILYVHPFDDPELWAGHAGLVHEIKAAWPHPEDEAPDAVVCVVGGGGLLMGLVQGMAQVGWSHVPILAVETQGAHSLRASMDAGELVTLPEITSIAKSLGARRVALEAFKAARGGHPKLESMVVSDKQAVEACMQLLDQHRVLVEPACAAGLVWLYAAHKSVEAREIARKYRRVVVVVCGGNQVSLELLEQWKREFGVEHRARAFCVNSGDTEEQGEHEKQQ